MKILYILVIYSSRFQIVSLPQQNHVNHEDKTE